MRSSARTLHPGILALTLVLVVALVGACDSSSDVTLLGTTTPTTAPVSFDAAAVVGTPFLGDIGSGPRLDNLAVAYSNGLWLAIGGRSPVFGAELWGSTDGVVWEVRHPPEFGGSIPVGVLTLEAGGWVAITEVTERVVAHEGFGELRFWYSPDAASWTEAEFDLGVGRWQDGVDYATAGSSAVLLVGGHSGSGSPESAAPVVYTTDAGVTWQLAPVGSEVRTVAAIGGDLVAGGSDGATPTLWRMSTGWKPEPVAGLGEARSVYSLVEIPGGSVVMVVGVPTNLVRTWYLSEDLRNWTESVPLGDFSSRAEIYRRGPFLLAHLSGQDWISADGTNWAGWSAAGVWGEEILGRGYGLAFATDGSNLIGVCSFGMVSDHPMVFAGAEYPGAWNHVATLPAGSEVWGEGPIRYVVTGGTVSMVSGGALVPLADPPVAIPDSAQIEVTESAVFVIWDGQVWVFMEEEWARSSLPLTEQRTSVFQQEGVLIVLTIESSAVRKYVSEDGVRWEAVQIPVVQASNIARRNSGWTIAGTNAISTPQGTYEDFMAVKAKATLDGSEWIDSTIGESIGSKEVVGENLVVSGAEGALEFALPAETTVRSVLWTSSEAAVMFAARAGAPNLLTITDSGDQIWAALEVADPLLNRAWYDGSYLYGLARSSTGHAIYVWNPDAE